MMKLQMAALLGLSVLTAATADPPRGGGPRSFPQRLSRRFTASSGLPPGKVLRIRAEGGVVTVETEAGPRVLSGEAWVPGGTAIPAFPVSVQTDRLPAKTRVLGAATAPNGTVWVVTERGAYRAEGERYLPVSFPKLFRRGQPAVDPDALFTCVAVDGKGHVWLGTTAGLYATDGREWWNPVEGLPYPEVTCLALPPDGDLWVGTTEGVCRFARGAWQYYWGRRWLPDNRVNSIAVDSRGDAWIATDGGAARLYEVPTTLARKAAHYEAAIRERFDRRGWIERSLQLKAPGDPAAGWTPEVSQNEGLWSSIYLGAACFRYAVTKDPKDRALARRTMNAMLDLVRLCGYDGYPARAIVWKDEKVAGYSFDSASHILRPDGSRVPAWFPSRVDPNAMCKGDTSSEEVCGHTFAWQLYYDLVADAKEKKEIARVCREVMDHILKHDLTLTDPSGYRTVWGFWSPELLNDDPARLEERGLNSLEILTFLTVAEHITGGRKYRATRDELIREHHYLLNTVHTKPGIDWWQVNHSDDQLAFLMYHAILTVEQDPDVRRVLLQALERSWRFERPERSPFFNFVYGGLTGRPCDVDEARAWLLDYPWELVTWEVRNAHRQDVSLRTAPDARRARTPRETTRVLPPSERALMEWNSNPFEPDGGSPKGDGEKNGSAWLLPYWMGRYYGLIHADE